MDADSKTLRQTWLGILLRSATLRERMASIRAVRAMGAGHPSDQFARWEQFLGGSAGDARFLRLRERLAWENFTLDQAALALKTLPPKARDHLLRGLMKRPWAKLLWRALPEFTRERLVLAAWKELRGRCIDAEWALAQSLQADLEADLHQRLDWWVEKLQAPPSPEQAALYRALATEATHWARSWKLFLRRWIIKTQAAAVSLDILEVQSGSSDPHKGGQRVIFSKHRGWNSVYKPRDVSHENDCAYNFSTRTPDIPMFLPSFASSRAKAGYGWMEMRRPGPPFPDEADGARRQARMAGGLLCLAHILGATDLHFENLIHTSQGPLLIDLESVFFRYTGPLALPSPKLGKTALETAARRADSSVLQTGLLPQWWRPQARTLWDISGLFGGEAERVSFPMEARVLTRERLASLTESAGLNAIDSAADLVDSFRATYRWLLGYRDMLLQEDSLWWCFNPGKTRYFHRPTREYERLRERLREPALLTDGVTRSFALERLFRLPFDIAGAQETPGTGDFPIADGTRTATGDSRPPAGEDALSIYRRALGRMSTMEAFSLERGDVPSFRIEDLERLGMAKLPLEISPIAAFAGGHEAFLRRILEEHVSEADLRRQINDLRTALSSAIDELQLYRHLATLPDEPDMSTEPSPDDVMKARENAALFAKAAETLAERLLARAVRGEDGSVLWVDGAGLKPTPSGHPLEAYYLYLGRLGPILFLAAAGTEQNRADFIATAQGALDPLLTGILEEDWTRQPSSYEPEVTPPRLDPGFGTGIGGLLYALAALSRWLPERAERLEAAARELLPLLDPELSHGWACADIESGLAGGLLGLLAAHQTWGLEHAVPFARTIAHYLDKRAVDGPAGGRAWYFPDAETGDLMAGFGHGASGIAAALCRLAETQGMATDSREAAGWLALAAAAWRYEATVFNAEARNWPVVGVGRPTGALFLNAWCNGAPGIGYSRVLGLDQDPDLLPAEAAAGLNADLLNALRTTLQKGISAYDHVCCGTGARLEALLSIAPRLPADFPKAAEYRKVMFSSAASLGRAMLNRAFTRNPEASAGENDDPAEAPPVFRLTPNAELDLAFNSGFFRGLSGLGYLYLRLAQEQRALAQSHTDALDDPNATTPNPLPGDRLPSIIFGEL